VSSILPVNIEDLLLNQGIESSRVEYKASWSAPTSHQVLKTICAFANDFQNLNGGYIIIGVAEKDGCAVLPPKGVAIHEEEKVFRGGIHEQTKQMLNYFESFLSLYIEKRNSFETKSFVNYPLPALREALANAVYHGTSQTGKSCHACPCKKSQGRGIVERIRIGGSAGDGTAQIV
jgi:predicted HTH transcriptional regulator